MVNGEFNTVTRVWMYKRRSFEVFSLSLSLAKGYEHVENYMQCFRNLRKFWITEDLNFV